MEKINDNKCEECGGKFSTKGDLLKHKRTIHEIKDRKKKTYVPDDEKLKCAKIVK